MAIIFLKECANLIVVTASILLPVRAGTLYKIIGLSVVVAIAS